MDVITEESDNENAVETDQLTGKKILTLSGRRWAILGAYSLLGLINTWMYITWSPLNDTMRPIWRLSAAPIDQLSNLFQYTFVFCCLPVLWLLSELGLRNGLVLSATLNMLGGFGRWYCWTDYWMVYAWSICAALANVLSLPLVPALVGAWFGENERALACSVGFLAQGVGMLLGLGATAVMPHFDSTDVSSYLLVQFIATVIVFMLIFTIVSDRPPSPPSIASQTPSLSFSESLKTILFSRSEILFTICYGLIVGTYFSLVTFLPQMLPEWEYVTKGVLGVSFTSAGLVGTAVAGVIIDKTRRHRLVNVGLYAGSLVSLFVWAAVMYFASSVTWLVFFAATLTGLFLSPVLAAGLEYGTGLAFPANESTSSGLLLCTAFIVACVQINICADGIEVATPAAIAQTNLSFVLTTAAALMILVIGVDTSFHRMSAIEK